MLSSLLVGKYGLQLPKSALLTTRLPKMLARLRMIFAKTAVVLSTAIRRKTRQENLSLLQQRLRWRCQKVPYHVIRRRQCRQPVLARPLLLLLLLLSLC